MSQESKSQGRSEGLTRSRAWSALQRHRDEIAPLHMRDLFASDPQRFQRFSLGFNDLLVDYSKHRINEETVALLLDLAQEREIQEWAARMFDGAPINNTEGRAVLHTALRNRSDRAIYVDGEDVMPAVRAVLARMRRFSDAVRSGEWTGYTGKPIRDVVNIGIGGSDLGPVMATAALRPYWHERLRLHFVANVEGSDIADTLAGVDPETTLFLVASKTFTTWETLTNAHTARSWFLESAGDEKAIAKHFAALSTNREAVTKFGIDVEHMFEFWDWVGGRYSMWSAIGMPIALAVGMDRFEEMLTGAYEMDCHFRDAEPERNLPMILGLLGLWYNDFFAADTLAVLPYEQHLEHLPAYLQQLDMESNGKHVTREGHAVEVPTGPVIWGGVGGKGQHAFFQLLHQGTRLIPTDFLAPLEVTDSPGDHQTIMLANCIAQTEALMRGRNESEARSELEAAGLSAGEVKRLLPHKLFPGNRPSTTILYRRLTPRVLGSLVALYEHKVFVQGVVWGINSFDQMGVELGKQLAQKVYPELSASGDTDTHDASTNGLINHYKRFKQAGPE
jgi:glucose-6-phosphate isomerase